MAQKVKVELIDDLDGGKAEETVTFGLDGRGYDIDLSGKNAKALRKVLAPYIGSARKVSGRRQSQNGTRGSAAGRGPTTQEVREWARSQGIAVADRGRIPADLVERFQAATKDYRRQR